MNAPGFCSKLKVSNSYKQISELVSQNDDYNQLCSNFDFSGPFSEMVLMGNLAVRFPYTRLNWDGENMQVTNHPEANAYVRRPYREGWSL